MIVKSEEGVSIVVMASNYHGISIDMYGDKCGDKVLSTKLTPEQAALLAAALTKAVAAMIKL